MNFGVKPTTVRSVVSGRTVKISIMTWMKKIALNMIDGGYV